MKVKPSILSIRARNEAMRKDNKLAHAMRYLPAAVQTYYAERFEGEAEVAFATLLNGSTHICPSCHVDHSPRGPSGQVFTCGCERPNWNAVRAWLEMQEAVGAQPVNVFLMNFMNKYQLRDESELSDLLELARNTKEMQADTSTPIEALQEQWVRALEHTARKVPLSPDLADRLESLPRSDGRTNGNGLPHVNGDGNEG